MKLTTYLSVCLFFLTLSVTLAQKTGINKVPEKALDVHGEIRGDSSLTIGPSDDTDGDSSLYFNNGKLGIGTTNPTGQFEVIGFGTFPGSPTDLTSPGGAVSVSHNTHNQDVNLMIDNVETGRFYTQGSWPKWVKYDFGTGNQKLIRQYKMILSVDAQYNPTAWTFEGSNDNSQWDVLDSRTNTTLSTSSSTFNVFDIANPSVAYRYYQINIPGSSGGNPDLYVREIELIEGPRTVADRSAFKVDSGKVTISDNYTLPVLDGSANQVISTDGNGNLSGQTPATGTSQAVTSLIPQATWA